MSLQSIEYRERFLKSRLEVLDRRHLEETRPIRDELEKLEIERCRLMQSEIAVGL